MAAAYMHMYQSLNCAGVVGVGEVGWMWVCACVCTEYGVCTLFHPPLPAIIPSGTIHRSLLAAATPPDDTSLCSHPGDTAGEWSGRTNGTRDAEGHTTGGGVHPNPRWAWSLGTVTGCSRWEWSLGVATGCGHVGRYWT